MFSHLPQRITLRYEILKKRRFARHMEHVAKLNRRLIQESVAREAQLRDKLKRQVEHIWESENDPNVRTHAIRKLEGEIALEVEAHSLDLRDRFENLQQQSLPNPRERLQRPPGSYVRSALAFLLPNNAFDKIFSQQILDMREEYFEALDDGRGSKAKWIVVRDHFRIVITLTAYLAASLGKTVAAVWKLIP